ncbi:BclA C-terminal domain-containing protein [Fictibacillus fluitans]|uniref:Collagen-like protein n=1 Tax=Fictibacillus fluitans TaxID=3058422 RepID=A0ABT8HSZ8_9BACL|nr:collagen-like protein [Fictibacillus sp. NE201]MDN4523905.1 collagen-like protein [Fictibacillus sp. NE201]
MIIISKSSKKCKRCGHGHCSCTTIIPVPLPGTPGAPGAQGPQGPAGTAASTDYAYIYQSAAENVAAGTDVTFDKNGTIFGAIAHTVGDAAITLNTPGNYKIFFSVTAQEVNQFALFLDGTQVPGTIYGSADTSQQNTGVAIINVAAPSVLTLRNLSDTAVQLETIAGGTAFNVTASILIQRL